MALFSDDLLLKHGEHVLEIGCGLGGPANYLAETYGVAVTGVDLAPAMVEACNAKQEKKSSENKVNFVCGSVTDCKLFGEAEFDVVYTRDCGMYLTPEMKADAFANIAKWLKPGGRFMVGDYGQRSASKGPLSEVFLNYRDSTEARLVDAETYTSLIQGTG